MERTWVARRRRCNGVATMPVGPSRYFEKSLGGLLADFCETRSCKKFLVLLARPKRFELLTPRFVVWCSNHSMGAVIWRKLGEMKTGAAK